MTFNGELADVEHTAYLLIASAIGYPPQNFNFTFTELRSLTMRPFSPALAPTILKLGLPAVRPCVHAEQFAQLMREESARTQSGSRSAYARL